MEATAMNLDEQDQAERLMRAHRQVDYATDVCLCGHIGYSTTGYYLHLYEVIQKDVERRLAEMPMSEMIDRLFKAAPSENHPVWRYRGGQPPETG